MAYVGVLPQHLPGRLEKIIEKLSQDIQFLHSGEEDSWK
jgi:hypothetical protein